MSSHSVTPFQQGHLDGLCGIYCVINTIHALHGPLPDTTATELFIDTLQHLDKVVGPTLSRLEDGTSLRDLSKALQSVTKLYPIRWARPFHKRRDFSLDDYWRHAQSFFSDKQGVVIINVAKDDEYDHWTLAHRISEKSLFLLDSDGMGRLLRRVCTVEPDDADDRIYINPRVSFFIWRDLPDQGECHG